MTLWLSAFHCEDILFKSTSIIIELCVIVRTRTLSHQWLWLIITCLGRESMHAMVYKVEHHSDSSKLLVVSDSMCCSFCALYLVWYTSNKNYVQHPTERLRAWPVHGASSWRSSLSHLFVGGQRATADHLLRKSSLQGLSWRAKETLWQLPSMQKEHGHLLW